MKKVLNASVVVLLLLIPVAIGWQVYKQFRNPRSNDPAPALSPKAFQGDPAADRGGGGKPPKGPKGGADPAQKGGKGKKQPVAAGELPAEVKSALEKHVPTLEFSKLEMEVKDGQSVYTAKWGEKAAECEVKLTADGTVLEAKEMVAFDTLPAAVRTAVNQAQPSATSFECKKLSNYEDGQNVIIYEVRGQAAGEKLPPLRVSAQGTVTETKRGKGK